MFRCVGFGVSTRYLRCEVGASGVNDLSTHSAALAVPARVLLKVSCEPTVRTRHFGS